MCAPGGGDRRRLLSHRFEEAQMIKRTGFVLMAMAGVALSTGKAAATEVSKVTFSGAQASAAFIASTSITCADDSGGFAIAYGSLQGSEQIYASTGSPPYTGNGTYIVIDAYYNSCTGVSISGASGGISGGFTAPDNKLTSASLTGSGTVQEYVYGNQLSISLNVQVVGVGTTGASKTNSHSKLTGTKSGPLYINHDHGTNSNRTAEASGSITIDGVTFSSFQTIYGYLNANGASSMSISK
jgi:hypothetical protein